MSQLDSLFFEQGTHNTNLNADFIGGHETTLINTGLKISRKRSFPVTCRLRAGKMTEPKNGFRWRYEQNQLYKFVKI